MRSSDCELLLLLWRWQCFWLENIGGKKKKKKSQSLPDLLLRKSHSWFRRKKYAGPWFAVPKQYRKTALRNLWPFSAQFPMFMSPKCSYPWRDHPIKILILCSICIVIPTSSWDGHLWISCLVKPLLLNGWVMTWLGIALAECPRVVVHFNIRGRSTRGLSPRCGGREEVPTGGPPVNCKQTKTGH